MLIVNSKRDPDLFAVAGTDPELMMRGAYELCARVIRKGRVVYHKLHRNRVEAEADAFAVLHLLEA